MSYIEQFIGYLKTEKRASEHTVVAYQYDLKTFKEFIAPESLETINYQHIRSWIVYLMDQGLVSKSVNRKLSTLRKFYKYLLVQGVINKNPTTKISGPKIAKRLPEYVPEKDMEKLDLIFEQVPDDWEGLRNKMIVILFYETGIRLSELINLETNNVLPDHIKVIGKRNKERIIPIRKELFLELNAFLIKTNIHLGKNDNFYFFTKKNGTKLYEKLVYRIVNNYLGKATGIEKKSPHTLRHTFATHMLNNGADLNAIKELLGHANLAATQIYTHNSFAKLKNIYQNAHPRGGQ